MPSDFFAAWVNCNPIYTAQRKIMEICEKNFSFLLRPRIYNCGMKKSDAITALGGTPMLAKAAMGYKSVQAIYMWPDVLSPGVADRVAGVVASRTKQIKKPKSFPATLAEGPAASE